MSVTRIFQCIFLLAAVLITVIVVHGVGQGQAESDTLWHIKAGQYVLEHGLIEGDPFSWTMQGQPWFAHEWLWEVLAAIAFNAGGPLGVWLFTSFWVCVFAASLWLLLRARCSLPRAVLIYSVVLLASHFFWNSRPHVMAEALFALWLLILFSAKSCPRLLYLLPLVEVIWANIHGSAPLGPVIALGMWVLSCREWQWGLLWSEALGDVRRTLGTVTVLSFLASLINPRGIELWWYIVAASRDSLIVDTIMEWKSPDFHNIVFWPIFILVIVLIGFLVRDRRDARGLPVLELLLTMGFLVLCLQQLRHAPYFYLTCGLAIAVFWGKDQIQDQVNGPWIKVGVCAIAGAYLLAGAILSPPTWITSNTGESDFPIAAVNYLKSEQLDDGRLFNDYYWGGYLIWEGVRPFIDGRADMYAFNGDVFKDYFGIVTPGSDKREDLGLEEEPQFYLDKYSIDTVLIYSGSALDWYLDDKDGWRQAYRDETAVVYVRQQ